MFELCHTCKSEDRKLVCLGNLSGIYNLLKTGNGERDQKYSQVKICWECHKLLLKFKKFQKNISLLHNYGQHCKKPTSTFGSLSTLKTITKVDVDFTFIHDGRSEVVHNKTDDIKLESTDVEIKIEKVDVLDDNYIVESQDNDLTNDALANDENSVGSYSSDENLSQIKNKLVKSITKKSNSKNQIPTKKNMKLRCEFLLLTDKILKNIHKDNIEVYVMSDEELEKNRLSVRLSEAFTKADHKCSSCLVTFSAQEQLEKHNKLKHVKEDHSFPSTKCNVCSSFVRANVFYRHYSCHFVVYKCALCGHSSDGHTSLRKHMSKHGLCNDVKATKCKLCEAIFPYDRALQVHMEKVHSNPGEYKCDQCDRTFEIELYLQEHLRRHKLPQAVCNVCGKALTNSMYLKRHIKTVHSDVKVKEFLCECGAAFGRQQLLLNHRRSSMKHNDLKYICDLCGKGYTLKYMLKQHVLSLHSNADVDCPICKKTFTCDKTLRVHQKYVHEKQMKPRNYECKFCDKKYNSSSILRDHENTHTGARPHKCAACGDTFRHKSALFTHRRQVHMGFKKDAHQR